MWSPGSLPLFFVLSKTGEQISHYVINFWHEILYYLKAVSLFCFAREAKHYLLFLLIISRV